MSRLSQLEPSLISLPFAALPASPSPLFNRLLLLYVYTLVESQLVSPDACISTANRGADSSLPSAERLPDGARYVAAYCSPPPPFTNSLTISITAPEPRDIQWFNLSLSPSSVFIRQILVVMTLLVLLSVWLIPVLYLAKLISWSSIEEAAPKLAKWIGKR